MRFWTIPLLLVLTTVPIFAACGGTDPVLRDPVLRRQWLIRRDCRYPARPGRLVEVPWDDLISPSADESAPAAHPKVLLIRQGMKITVERESHHALMHLTGTALEPGYAGQRIL